MDQMVPAVAAAVRLMEAVAAGLADGPIRSVAQRLAMPPASCFRTLRTLEQSGWIATDPGAKRALAPGLKNLVNRDRSHRRLVRTARPLVRQLASQLGLSVKLSVRVADQAMTLARGVPETGFAVVGSPGSRFSLAVGSSGAMLCADLPESDVRRLAASPGDDRAFVHASAEEFLKRVRHARAHGWCFDRGSHHPQVHSVSVPVSGRNGRTIAVVTAIGMPHDLPATRYQDVRAVLADFARILERSLNASSASIASSVPTVTAGASRS